jgi:rhodanese-related sulfurtransferase
MPRPDGASATACLVLTLTLGLPACASDTPLDWSAVDALIEQDFPDVPSVTTAELAALLNGPKYVVLLDARAEEEYAVSHLEGAHRVTSVAEVRTALRGTPEDAVIVAYCSVGYRSARLADALRADGIDNVVNLQGSIFAWANEGRAVYQGERPVRRVHPFDDRWGMLLSPPLHAVEP